MAATQGLALRGARSPDRLQERSGRARALSSTTVLALVGLTAIGVVLRVIVAHQSVFADELSTYWISTKHSLGGVLSLLYSTGRIQHAEITPPLSFLASWLTTRLGDSPELLRLPALVAGTATIPLVYFLGARTVGRRAGLAAAALTTFSPFMIYYSAEARAYGLLMALTVTAVLAMLLAVDTRRVRYWALFSVCAAAAFYTHYTCLFVLGVALVWVLWAHPEARRPALLATGAAGLLAVPWIPGLIADLQSPTVKILSALSAFTPTAVRLDLEHWSIGYPYSVVGLREIPGVAALVLLGLAAAVSLVGLGVRIHRTGVRVPPRPVILIFLLAIAAPVGESIVSAFGNHIIGARDLAVSWPFLALFCSAVAFAAGRRLGLIAVSLAVVAFAVGAFRMLESRFQRPDYQGAADFVAAHARTGDVVIDATGILSPGPLTGFDVSFHRRLPVVRWGAAAERVHPFTVFDPRVPPATAVREAVRLAQGRPVFLVAPQLLGSRVVDPARHEFHAPYRLTTLRSFPGIQPTVVAIYTTGSR
jgi:hypothetical protein